MDTYSNYPVGSSDHDFGSAAAPRPADDELANEALSFTRALNGRPGGPGFRPSAGSASEVARPPWQRSQQLWHEWGIPWDAPEDSPAPVPEPRSAAGKAPQAKYQGRHARSRTPASQPDDPLSAPVFAAQAAELDQAVGLAPDKGHSGRRRIVTVVLPTAVGATVAAVAITLLTQHGPSHETASRVAPRIASKSQAPHTVGIYSG